MPNWTVGDDNSLCDLSQELINFLKYKIHLGAHHKVKRMNGIKFA